jgi:hypothetical protein
MPAPQKGVPIANVDQQKNRNRTGGNKMKRKIEMSEIPIGIAASEGVVLAVLTHLKHGKIDDAIAHFAEEFSFKDHGIGLQFKHKERLAEFFKKARELYPNSFLQTNTIFVSGITSSLNGHFKPPGQSLSTVNSHERFESRCRGLHRAD